MGLPWDLSQDRQGSCLPQGPAASQEHPQPSTRWWPGCGPCPHQLGVWGPPHPWLGWPYRQEQARAQGLWVAHPTWALPGLALQWRPWPCCYQEPGLHTAPETHGQPGGMWPLPGQPGPSGWTWPWRRSGQPGHWAWSPPPPGKGWQPRTEAAPRLGEALLRGSTCVPGWTYAQAGLGGPPRRASRRGPPWEPRSFCCWGEPSGCPSRSLPQPEHPHRRWQAWSHPASWPPSAAGRSEPWPLACGLPPHSRPPPSGHRPASGPGWGPCWQRPPAVGHIHLPGAARGPQIGLQGQVGSGLGEDSPRAQPWR